MGMQVGMGFRVGANMPLDEKLIVDTYADLEAMPIIERWLGKPAIYVKELDKSYYLPYPSGGLNGQPQEYYMTDDYWKLAEGQEGFETFPAIRVSNETEFLAAAETLHTNEGSAVGGWIILTANITLTSNRTINANGITIFGNGYAIDFGLVRWYNSLPAVYVLTLQGPSSCAFNNVIFRGNVQLETDTESQHLITMQSGGQLELFNCRFSHVIGSDSDTHPVIKLTGNGTAVRIKLYNTESSTNFTVSSSRDLYSGLGIEVAGAYKMIDVYVVDFMGAEPPEYSRLISQVHLFGAGSASVRKVLHHDGAVTVATNSLNFDVDNTSLNETVLKPVAETANQNFPRWDADATQYGTDRFNFNALPGGRRTQQGAYQYINTAICFATQFMSGGSGPYRSEYTLNHNSGAISYVRYADCCYGAYVRCVKDYDQDVDGVLNDGDVVYNAYVDADGNSYSATRIGNQLWLRENLRVTKFTDGEPIFLEDDLIQYGSGPWYDAPNKTIGYNISTGGVPYRSIYGRDDQDNLAAFGYIYNGFAIAGYDESAVAHQLVDATTGFRVPTVADWDQMIDYLVDAYADITTENVGNALKSIRQSGSTYQKAGAYMRTRSGAKLMSDRLFIQQRYPQHDNEAVTKHYVDNKTFAPYSKHYVINPYNVVWEGDYLKVVLTDMTEEQAKTFQRMPIISSVVAVELGSGTVYLRHKLRRPSMTDNDYNSWMAYVTNGVENRIQPDMPFVGFYIRDLDNVLSPDVSFGNIYITLVLGEERKYVDVDGETASWNGENAIVDDTLVYIGGAHSTYMTNTFLWYYEQLAGGAFPASVIQTTLDPDIVDSLNLNDNDGMLKRAYYPVYARAKNADIIIEAYQHIADIDLYSNPDILNVICHYNNTGKEYNYDYGTTDDFPVNVIRVGAGDLDDADSAWVTSYGTGMEFIEPTKRDDIGTAGGVNWIDTHQQSPATAIVSAKMKYIRNQTGVGWNLIRQACRATATQSAANIAAGVAWDKYRGFGVINVSAAIAYIEAHQASFKAAVADRLAEGRSLPSDVELSDVTDDTLLSKKLVQEMLNGASPVVDSLSVGFKYDITAASPLLTQIGNADLFDSVFDLLPGLFDDNLALNTELDKDNFFRAAKEVVNGAAKYATTGTGASPSGVNKCRMATANMTAELVKVGNAVHNITTDAVGIITAVPTAAADIYKRVIVASSVLAAGTSGTTLVFPVSIDGVTKEYDYIEKGGVFYAISTAEDSIVTSTKTIKAASGTFAVGDTVTVYRKAYDEVTLNIIHDIQLFSGQANAGGAGTLTFDTAEDLTSIVAGDMIRIVSGAGSQNYTDHLITAVDNTTKTITTATGTFVALEYYSVFRAFSRSGDDIRTYSPIFNNTQGQGMLRLERVYYKEWWDGNYHNKLFSKIALPGFKPHPVFERDGSNNRYFFFPVGWYAGYDGSSKCVNLPGYYPAVNANIDTFRTRCKRNSSDYRYHQADEYAYVLLQDMMQLKFLTRDLQAPTEYAGKNPSNEAGADWSGFNGYYPLWKTWYTAHKGLTNVAIRFKEKRKTFEIDTYEVNFMGINPYGHIWTFSDGCMVHNSLEHGSRLFLSKNPSEFTGTLATVLSQYKFAGNLPASDNYIKRVGDIESGAMPLEGQGSSSQFYPDFFYTYYDNNPNCGVRVLLRRGSVYYGAYVGPGYRSAFNGWTNANVYIGGALCGWGK